MMELYGLIAEFSFAPSAGEEEQRYFVPAQLRSSPSGLCEIKPSKSDPCPLYLCFLNGFVPHGLFPQLLSRCVRWCSRRGPRQTPNLYHNGARLFIGKQTIYDLILICKKRFIKINLKQRSPSSTVLSTAAASMGCEVRIFLEDTLRSLSLEFSWLRNLRYELCVVCARCFKLSEKCVKHRSVSCGHEDCLHLLRVNPEEHLICPRSFCDEAIEVPGLEKWFRFYTTEVQILLKFLNYTCKRSVSTTKFWLSCVLLGMGSLFSSLRKQPSFFAPGPSGVSREGRLRFTAEIPY